MSPGLSSVAAPERLVVMACQQLSQGLGWAGLGAVGRSAGLHVVEQLTQYP